MISYKGCDMIAMKREVAATMAGFPWSECQVRKLTTSHCTNLTAVVKSNCSNAVCSPRDTHGDVYSHRLSYFKQKCEKEATFFMASQVMRITLKAYDHQLVDQSAGKSSRP